MKYLVFDAGPIISLTMNGMLPVIEKLKSVFDGEFILTPAVKREVVDRPMKIKKFKLEALQVTDMIERGVFKMSGDIVSNQKLDKETKKVLKSANGVLRSTATGAKIAIIQEGEAACLAFINLVKASNGMTSAGPGDCVIVIDERTTRMLTEAPDKLEEMMERKFHTPLDSTLSLIDGWKRFKFIRSAELLYVAWKKDLILGDSGKRNKELLDALLYGVKFKGCAISSVEIEEMKKLAS
ncbi:hypothetical protein HN903_02890 [archaeon]|jgi:hypothetical protein|nr:hypothetical protein [archaeon]MBT7128679.1 hypothetical protein [archaeon]